MSKIDEQYEKYSKAFNAMKSEGAVKRGTRKLGVRQFESFMKAYKQRVGGSYTEARNQILEAQNKFGALSKRDVQEAYRYYKAGGYKTEGKTGETGTYFGQKLSGAYGGEEGEELGKSYNEFKRNVTAHQIIAMRIRLGDSREEVLEEYGY